MSIQEEIAGTLEELEGDLVPSGSANQMLVLPNGKELPWVPSMELVGTEILVCGQAALVTCSGNVRKEHFLTADLTTLTVDSTVALVDNQTPRLRAGKKPVFRSKQYRVLSSDEDPTGAYFHVRLGSGL